MNPEEQQFLAAITPYKDFCFLRKYFDFEDSFVEDRCRYWIHLVWNFEEDVDFVYRACVKTTLKRRINAGYDLLNLYISL